MKHDPATRKARTTPATPLGCALRSLRLSARLSVRALAEKAGLHPPFVTHLEKGTRGPTLRTLDRMATALGITTQDIITARDAHSPRFSPEFTQP